MSVQSRDDLKRAQTVIVKVGSALLAQGEHPSAFVRIAEQIAQLRAQHRRVVVVSSGAIALGLERLGFAERPTALSALQACAAAGQGRLQRQWDEAFAAHSLGVAQILLTHADLQNRRRFLNAQGALNVLLDRGAIPIVNENDTVSVDEIKLGDNDTLAAQVCGIVGGDVVVLLTSANGLHTNDPSIDPTSERIALVDDIADVEKFAKGAARFGTGGMRTKLDAAKIGRTHGAATVIVPGAPEEILLQVFRGDDVGTLVTAGDAPALTAKKRWLSSTIRPRGSIIVDRGARRAVELQGASLLAAGVVRVEGEFSAHDAVQICSATGQPFAHGLAATSSHDIAARAGTSRDDSAASPLVVHRDDLVLLHDAPEDEAA